MNQNSELQLASDLRTAVTRLVKKLRKESVTGQQLSLTERSVMSMLYQHKQLLPSELASSEKITNQSMSQILNHLLGLGYISRKASETDKRKVIISLTSAGEKTLLQMRSERDEWLTKAIAESCSADEIDLLRKTTTVLAKIVNYQ